MCFKRGLFKIPETASSSGFIQPAAEIRVSISADFCARFKIGHTPRKFPISRAFALGLPPSESTHIMLCLIYKNKIVTQSNVTILPHLYNKVKKIIRQLIIFVSFHNKYTNLRIKFLPFAQSEFSAFCIISACLD